MAIYKHDRGFELGATVKRIEVVVRKEALNPGPLDYNTGALKLFRFTPSRFPGGLYIIYLHRHIQCVSLAFSMLRLVR